MKKVFTITQATLTIEDLSKFLATPHTIELSKEVIERVKANRAFLEAKLNEKDARYYGINRLWRII